VFQEDPLRLLCLRAVIVQVFDLVWTPRENGGEEFLERSGLCQVELVSYEWVGGMLG